MSRHEIEGHENGGQISTKWQDMKQPDIKFNGHKIDGH